jgi:hypothetical protein
VHDGFAIKNFERQTAGRGAIFPEAGHGTADYAGVQPVILHAENGSGCGLAEHAGEIVGNEGAAGDVLKNSEIENHGFGKRAGDAAQHLFRRKIAQVCDAQLAAPRFELLAGAALLVLVERAGAIHNQHIFGFRQHVQRSLQSAGHIVAVAQNDQGMGGGVGQVAEGGKRGDDGNAFKQPVAFIQDERRGAGGNGDDRADLMAGILLLEEVRQLVAIGRAGVAAQVQVFGENRAGRNSGGAQGGPEPFVGPVVTGEAELPGVEDQDIFRLDGVRRGGLGLGGEGRQGDGRTERG